MDPAHRPVLGPQLERTLYWVPLRWSQKHRLTAVESHNSVQAQIKPRSLRTFKTSYSMIYISLRGGLMKERLTNSSRLFITSVPDCTSVPGRTTSGWSLWPVRTSARRTLRRTRSRRRWCWRKSPAACRPGTVKLRTTWKKQDVSVGHLGFIGILHALFRSSHSGWWEKLRLQSYELFTSLYLQTCDHS